jgi:hypothetical protein
MFTVLLFHVPYENLQLFRLHMVYWMTLLLMLLINSHYSQDGTAYCRALTITTVGTPLRELRIAPYCGLIKTGYLVPKLLVDRRGELHAHAHASRVILLKKRGGGGWGEEGKAIRVTGRGGPQEDSRHSFLLEAESIPEPLCGWKD